MALTEQSADYETYWITAYEQTQLIFEVKGCSRAKILLTNKPGIAEPSSMELIIGDDGNKKVTLQRWGAQTEVLKSVESLHILKCAEYQVFWYKWENNVYAFGMGLNVGYNEILKYEDTEKMKVNGMSFTSRERNVEWRLTNENG